MSLGLTFVERFRKGFATILTPNPFRRPVWWSDRVAIERALCAWEMAQQLDLSMDEHWDRYRAVREALYDEAADAAAKGVRLYPDPHRPEEESVIAPPELERVAWSQGDGAAVVTGFERELPHGAALADPCGDDDGMLIGGTYMAYAEYRALLAPSAPIEGDDD
ncbi:hypothetical protein [Marinivivus vitaminiproducens]|uniref:hypothetical protein n=1 Tax=Marinivivus vitaminiproducens TaxID=3035935 RepID=UPI00279EA392|nr:hypothetical protein P4R82_24710 [Geminicoccaceae bacterium SCSIO 64248]